MWYILLSMASLYAIGGLPYLVWGFFLRVTFAFHYTWSVNSLAHVYGSQAYVTGDLSRNLARGGGVVVVVVLGGGLASRRSRPPPSRRRCAW